MMAKVDTKQVFDEYFATKPEKIAYRMRGCVDRKEVYEFEKRIGKQIFDMNEDELFDMILTFKSSASSRSRFAPSTLNTAITCFRGIFDYYARNYEVILNPFRYQKLSISNIVNAAAANSETITKETVGKIILGVRNNLDDQMAVYVECIIQLAYCGFKNPEEIVLLKEEMIDFKNRVVYLRDREVRLNPRCAMLLKNVHSFESRNIIESGRNYIAVPFEGGYFKFFVNDKTLKNGEMDAKRLANGMTNRVIIESRAALGYSVSYRNIFLLGFYDHLCEMWGKEKTNEMIKSTGSGEINRILCGAANEYGVNSSNSTVLKRQLSYFL